MPSQNTPPFRSGEAPRLARLLALETSSRQGSIAVVEVGTGELSPILTRELPPLERSAQTLVPAIQELLSETGWEPPSLDCVAIATGPGSFTGLRVGVTTAKTLAYATGAKLVAINTLDAIAEPSWLEKPPSPSPPEPATVWALVDAQRNEVFAARYATPYDGPPHKETLVERLTQAEFFAKLEPNDRVIAPHAPVLRKRFLSPRCEAKDITWITAQPMADAVARLGAAKWRSNQLADPFQLAPQYHRASAAEENLP